MAYDKKPMTRGKSGGGNNKFYGDKPKQGGGYRGQSGDSRTEQGYKKSGPGSYSKPGQSSGQGGSYGKGAPSSDRKDAPKVSYDSRRNELYDGKSTRPSRPQQGANPFFDRDPSQGQGRPAPGRPAQGRPAQGGPAHGGPAQGRPAQGKPAYRQGPGPRMSTPPTRPVPASVRDDHQARPSYPFKSAPIRSAPPVQPQMPAQDSFEEENASPENILAGRNPIREAIKAGRPMEKILVAEGELSGSARQIVAWAREAHIVVQFVDRSRLDQIYKSHQGMIAFTSGAEYHTVEEMLDYAKEKGEDPFIIVLDSITDPHNLGAIIRTAECAGAHGVIITERRSAGLTPAAVKAAAGACEYQRVAKVVNLTRTLQELKEAGLWIIGANTTGEKVGNVDLTGPIVLVIGSEGEGISQLVLKQCDHQVSLPIVGKIDSLNASVAAGILMYEVRRARGN